MNTFTVICMFFLIGVLVPVHAESKQKAAAETSSITDNGNGTVTDRRTALIWQQGESGLLTLNAADAYCKELTVAGSNDWRLPNREELLTLVILDKKTNSIQFNSTAFLTAVMSEDSNYWSFDTYNTYNWVVNIYTGKMGSYDKAGIGIARCVRGGLDAKAKKKVAAKARRLSDNGNGTVTDRLTDLIWQQGESGLMTWKQADTYCKKNTLAGSKDWQLRVQKNYLTCALKRIKNTLKSCPTPRQR